MDFLFSQLLVNVIKNVQFMSITIHVCSVDVAVEIPGSCDVYWNEQYSRKKSIKIYNMKESRGEHLIQDFVGSLKEKVNVEISPSEIVAMHRIPGKHGAPRPVIVKFLRMENKITVLKNRKALQEMLDKVLN
jgi:hypothetical protein